MLAATIFGGADDCNAFNTRKRSPKTSSHVALFARQRFPSGEKFRGNLGKKRQIVDQIIDIVAVRAEYDERCRGMPGESRRGQRARRAPDSVEGRRMSSLQTGDHFGKTSVSLQTPGQVLQTIGHRGSHPGL